MKSPSVWVKKWQLTGFKKKFIARGQRYAEDPEDELTTDEFQSLKLIDSANFKE